MKLDRGDLLAYGTYAAAAGLILLAMFLQGCGHATPPPVTKLLPEPGSSLNVELYQIPVVHGEIEVPPGWEDSRAVAEIEVPPRPDGKPTKLRVRPRKRSLGQQLFPGRESVTLDLVSDNPGAKATQEPVTPWWWWALAVLALCAAAWALFRRYSFPVKWLLGWLTRLRRK